MRSARLLSLLLMLQTRGRVTAPQAAAELEVSVRTVYRDVESLSAAGVPVWTEQGHGGGIVLMPGYTTDMTGLTRDETTALLALTGQALPDDLGLGSALADAVHKLVAAVPASHRAAAEQARHRVLVDHTGWFARRTPVPHLDVVTDAVWRHRRLRIGYRAGRDGGRRVATTTVDPYGLVVTSGRWYLVGAHGPGPVGTERMWRVDRVEQVTVLEDGARRDGDLAQVWRRLRAEVETPRLPVTVTVLVRTTTLEMLLRVTGTQRSGSDPQVPGPDRDEHGWTRLDLDFRAPRAAVAALLGFGGDVEVLSPPEVRGLMVETARQALARHGAG